MNDVSADPAAATPQTHAEWWKSGNAPDVLPGEGSSQEVPLSTYSDADAAASLRRAGRLLVGMCCIAVPVAWIFTGWRGATAFSVGAAISGSGLWEWRRLMAALTARMDAQGLVQAPGNKAVPHAPSIAFAIAGFTVRLLIVLAVLYASLKYLHGSVPALAAGLAMGVVALSAEAVRLLRSGTI